MSDEDQTFTRKCFEKTGYFGSCLTEMNSNKTTSEPQSQPIEQDDNMEENGSFDGFTTDLSVAVPSLPTDHLQKMKLHNIVKPLLENLIEDQVRCINKQEKKIQKLEMEAQKRIKRCMRMEDRNQKLEMANQDLIKTNKEQKMKIEKLNRYIKSNLDARAKMTSIKNMEDKKPTQEQIKENVEELITDGPGNPTGYVKPKVGNADCQNSGKDILGKEKRPLVLPSVYTTDEEPPFPPMNVNSCPCSCGRCVLLCLLREKYGHEYCLPKFSQMVSSKGTLKPNHCSGFLEDHRQLGYIEKVFVCKDIAASGGLDQVLRRGLKRLKKFAAEQTIPEEITNLSVIYGILSYKTDLSRHAVMIMSFDDINFPKVEIKIYDPQKHKWFPNSEPRLDMIHYVEMTAIKEDEGGPLIREWLDQCGMKTCEAEFKELGNASPSQCFDTSTSETETTTRFL